MNIQNLTTIPVIHLRQAAGGGGGADTVVLNWVEMLNQQRFSTQAVYLRKKSENISPLRTRFQNHQLPFHELPGGRIFDLRQFLQLRRHLISQGIRILHCHDSKADLYGRLMQRSLPSLKYASTLHNWISHSWRSGIYKHLDLWALRGFDLLTTPSRQVAEEAAKAGLKGIQLLPNGINLQEWTPDYSYRKNDVSITVGFAARLSREKGISDFVGVAAQVAKQVHSVCFKIAGEGPEKEAMRRGMDRAGLGKRCSFLGHLGKQDMLSHYRSLDVLLHTAHVEALPMTLLEAASAEVPIVATRVGDVERLLTHGHSAMLFAPGDIAGMASAIVKIVREPKIAMALGQAARKKVMAEYDLAEKIQHLEDLYLQILSDSEDKRPL